MTRLNKSLATAKFDYVPTTTSPAAQDYLKALYVLEEERRPPGSDPNAVATTALAHELGVSAASATNMLKKLDSMGLVAHIPYRGTGLTDAGRQVALEVIRHHRLLETYLAEALGVPWDEVHDEAEVLEHVLSEGLEERISSLLGNPTADPHGHPIPAKDGSVPVASRTKLWDAQVGATVTVAWVSDSEAEALRYLASVGIGPGTPVTVEDRGPIGGPLFVTVGTAQESTALSREVSEVVWVE
jgi:DtxR family transcriptional regulator, Mn-dependent transcriptional regulator